MKWIFLSLLLLVKLSYAQQLIAYEDSGKYGIKDVTSGKIVLLAKYDEIYTFSEGLAMVGLGGKYGYVDKTGKEVIA
ncbi:MAG: WG repeat-containing protein, partial [Chitinophagales bacterium]